MDISQLPSSSEILNRIKSFQNLLAKNQIELAIILENVDLYYFTGTMQKAILIIPSNGEVLFFVRKSLKRAKTEAIFEPLYFDKEKEVVGFIKEKGYLKGRVGMELDVLPAALYLKWKELLPESEIVSISAEIKELRMIKSPYEISQIKKAGEILDKVFEKAKEELKAGITELELAAALEAYGRRLGHTGIIRMRGFNSEMDNITITQGALGAETGFSDAPIIGYGLYAAVPHGASKNKIVKNEPVLIDCGICYNGYLVDETRPFVIGELKEPFLTAYHTSFEIIEEIRTSCREGVSGKDIFKKAYDLAKAAGLEDYFMGYGEGKVEFIGHGFGLEINELPVITPRHNMVLKENMVFALEPKFIFPNMGVIGIEVDFIVKKDGLERVTESSFEITYL